MQKQKQSLHPYLFIQSHAKISLFYYYAISRIWKVINEKKFPRTLVLYIELLSLGFVIDMANKRIADRKDQWQTTHREFPAFVQRNSVWKN